MKLSVLFVLLAVVLVGCTPQSTPLETNQTISNDVDLEIRDTRTEEEVTQEIIISLIEDGLYEDEVTYQYHSGEETVAISLRIEDGLVSEVSVVDAIGSPHPTSLRLINGVNAALQDLAIGKPIQSLQELPDQIAGSSLTVAAFKQFTQSLLE